MLITRQDLNSNENDAPELAAHISENTESDRREANECTR